MNDLVSEYFYEGICRIIPGLAVILMYWRIEAMRVFYTHADFFTSPLLFIAAVLPVAWLVGLTIDTVVYFPVARIICILRLLICLGRKRIKLRPVRWVLRSILKPLKRFKKWLIMPYRGDQEEEGNQNPKGKGDQAPTETALQRERRRQGYLITAEIIMSRCLWVIFLYTWIATRWLRPPENFSFLHWDNPWHSS